MADLEDKYREMTETPVPRLVVRLAIPSMISMVVTAFYNVVDTAFIGHLSTEATAGIGISFAYMVFIQAIGFFFGHGSGNYISRSLGARQFSQAGTMAAVGFFSPIILGTIAALICLPLLPQLATLLGAPANVVPYACNYLRYILIASPFMMSALTLNNQLRLQGNARFGMIGIVSGAILNIALDPLFIYVFKLGVSGASLATAISQLFAWFLLLRGTMKGESVHIRLSNFKPSWAAYREILAGGLPSLFRQVFNCTSVIMLNYAAAHYAPIGQEDSSVAAFAVVSRTTMFAYSLILGFTQGFQPVCGFNYGARLYARVKQSYLFTLIVTTSMLTVLSLLGYLFAPQIVAIFRSEDPVLLDIGIQALRWQCVVFPLCTLATATNMLFQNIRLTFPATLLAIGRQGLFFIPALIILPHHLGLQGVEMSQAVADLCTCLLAIPFAIWITRKLSKQKSLAS